MAAGDPPGHAGWPSRLAWLPIPVLLVVLAGLWVADLRTSYESPALLLLLNVVFTGLASLSICSLTARSFLRTGQPGLLMFSSGTLLWGTTALAAAWLAGPGMNDTVTVHNVGVFGTAACHLAGLLWRGRVARPGRWLALAYLAVLAATGLLVGAVVTGALPPFFVVGQGGTPLRQAVLLAAVGMFAWVAWQLLAAARRRPRSTYSWYGLGLALVATGLAGLTLQTVAGGVLGWTSRLAQYLGSAYLVVAAWLAARGAGAWTLSLTAVHEAVERYWRPEVAGLPRALRWVPGYLLAAVAVAAAFLLRLGLDRWVGEGIPPYLAFFPAVMAVALLAGFGPGLAATLLTAGTVWAWVLPVHGAHTPAERAGLVLFVAAGLAMVAVASVYRRYRDLAAAYQRDTALHESRARLAAFAEATFEGIVESEEGIILDCNEQLGRMLGYEPAELLGRAIGDLVAPEDRERVLENTRARRESMVEHGVVRRDGTRLMVEAHGRPMSPRGTRRLTALRDVTVRRRAEDALREADRRKNEFIGMLSHELRNPLAPIRNSLHLLERRRREPRRPSGPSR